MVENLAPESTSSSLPPTGQTTSTLALVSLISGVLAYIYLPLVGAIVAIITGHFARKEIRQSNGRLIGEGMASAGLVLGYIQLAVSALALCFVVTLAGLVIGGALTAPVWCGVAGFPAVITIP